MKSSPKHLRSLTVHPEQLFKNEVNSQHKQKTRTKIHLQVYNSPGRYSEVQEGQRHGEHSGKNTDCLDTHVITSFAGSLCGTHTHVRLGSCGRWHDPHHGEKKERQQGRDRDGHRLADPEDGHEDEDIGAFCFL